MSRHRNRHLPEAHPRGQPGPGGRSRMLVVVAAWLLKEAQRWVLGDEENRKNVVEKGLHAECHFDPQQSFHKYNG